MYTARVITIPLASHDHNAPRTESWKSDGRILINCDFLNLSVLFLCSLALLFSVERSSFLFRKNKWKCWSMIGSSLEHRVVGRRQRWQSLAHRHRVEKKILIFPLCVTRRWDLSDSSAYILMNYHRCFHKARTFISGSSGWKSLVRRMTITFSPRSVTPIALTAVVPLVVPASLSTPRRHAVSSVDFHMDRSFSSNGSGTLSSHFGNKSSTQRFLFVGFVTSQFIHRYESVTSQGRMDTRRT